MVACGWVEDGERMGRDDDVDGLRRGNQAWTSRQDPLMVKIVKKGGYLLIVIEKLSKTSRVYKM